MYGYATMKTLTELSGTLIRAAAKAIAEARRALPEEQPAEAAPAPAPEAAPVPEATPEGAAPEQAAAPAEATPENPAPAGKPAAPKESGEEAESEGVKAALDAAVGTATGLSGDRLDRLRDAVKVAGKRIADVRLVRVFGAEEPVPGAKSLNGFQYVVDLAPQSMTQAMRAPERGRGGRGGRGGGGGGRGGGGGGGGAKGASTTGGFSMDSLREDRKNARGGRPGGGRFGGRGRGPGGGGRPGGSGPGGGSPGGSGPGR